MVDGTYEIEIIPGGSQAGQWPPADGIHVRPAGVGELASFPPAASDESD
jgi:hypothetical protein